MAVIFYIKNDVLYLIFYLTLATVVKLPDINLTPSEPYFFSQRVLTMSAPLHRQGGFFSMYAPIGWNGSLRVLEVMPSRALGWND